MPSPLICYLRLMIEAYLYDGAYQSEEESQPYSLVESTTVLAGFEELIWELQRRMGKDGEFRSKVEDATKEMAQQLNGAILLNTNDLRREDAMLLQQSLEFIRPVPRPMIPLSDRSGIAAFFDAQMRAQEAAEREAESLGIDADDLPRWKALFNASVQDAEVLLLKYMLVSFSRLRKDELYHEMLKIKGLHTPERYALKRTLREALLCRVFGFDQAAAVLCGATIEEEIKEQLLTLGIIELRGNRVYGTKKSTYPDEAMDARALLNEAHAKGLLISESVLRKANDVLDLRNTAVHAPSKFNGMLKHDKYGQFVPETRDVLEALQN